MKQDTNYQKKLRKENKLSVPAVVEKKIQNMINLVCPIKSKKYKRFLDFQMMWRSDIELALREGYRSIEHVKDIQH